MNALRHRLHRLALIAWLGAVAAVLMPLLTSGTAAAPGGGAWQQVCSASGTHRGDTNARQGASDSEGADMRAPHCPLCSLPLGLPVAMPPRLPRPVGAHAVPATAGRPAPWPDRRAWGDPRAPPLLS